MERLPNLFGERQAPRQADCEAHGPYESQHLLRSVWSKCPACEVERTAAEKAEREEQARRERDRKHREALQVSLIPERFIGRSFENFKADTPQKRNALSVARDYSQNFSEYRRKGQGLLFLGKPGTGKSHLAAAILQAQMATGAVRYVTCLDVIRAIRETWRRDSERSERQLLNIIASLDLLVIDEMGVQYGTDGEQTILFDVLDARYRDMRPTILLSNQDLSGLRGYLGDRTFDRIKETSAVVMFDWESYRAQARKEAA